MLPAFGGGIVSIEGCIFVMRALQRIVEKLIDYSCFARRHKAKSIFPDSFCKCSIALHNGGNALATGSASSNESKLLVLVVEAVGGV